MSSYEFIAACPACDEGSPSKWTIRKCGHRAYIWTDLNVGCKCCSNYQNILDWYYNCGNKSCEGTITNIAKLIDAISALAEATNIPDNIWKDMNKRLAKIAKQRFT